MFGYEKIQLLPIYISKEKFENQMNLLLITEGKNRHYILIKDFNKFMYNQTKHKERKHFCMHCLLCFKSEIVLNNHTENCIIINGAQAIKMSKADDMVHFKNYQKQLPVPFVIYADFEGITKKVQGCKLNNDKSYNECYQSHKDCGYGHKVVCCYDDKYTKPVQIYRGENAVHNLMEEVLEEVKWCKKVMINNFNKPLKMTNEDERNFKKANKCHICDKKYKEEDIRVRDHCHIDGKYRGSAHPKCNLKLKIKPENIKVPVIFHNLRAFHNAGN